MFNLITNLGVFDPKVNLNVCQKYVTSIFWSLFSGVRYIPSYSFIHAFTVWCWYHIYDVGKKLVFKKFYKCDLVQYSFFIVFIKWVRNFLILQILAVKWLLLVRTIETLWQLHIIRYLRRSRSQNVASSEHVFPIETSK